MTPVLSLNRKRKKCISSLIFPEVEIQMFLVMSVGAHLDLRPPELSYGYLPSHFFPQATRAAWFLELLQLLICFIKQQEAKKLCV